MGATAEPTDTVQIGVALAVPAPFAQELAAARESFGDTQARAIPPHITILGPTEVSSAELPGIHQHLRDMACQIDPFLVYLRSAGTFRPVSQVVFVQVAQGIAECEKLEALVRSGPLASPARFHYHPHVTVAHDVADSALNVAFADMGAYEASFVVNDVILYEHGADGIWRPMESFPLGSSFDDDFPTMQVAPSD
ncbi:2'-5' RNA ligase family protein [Rarobacter incanus]|uniref:2'-5' RNA ligase n=1 Tax=Rarobacter incanus TaxID=153494 RepID=A0A542SNJ1_9MICO|nr:2'-5' RNA ligase family protein [Rarobacter incanus]TQK76105.1 2'-5' RNA ligase [Rarobacter incanus]